jgi:hypothetical protein
MTRIPQLILLVLTAGAVGASTARADTIALTGGSLDLGMSSAPCCDCCGLIHLVGEPGSVYDAESTLGWSDTGTTEPLLPGATVRLHGGGAGEDLGGFVRFDGIPQTGVGTADQGSIVLQFDAMVPMPSELSERAVVSAPFTVHGAFHWNPLDPTAGPAPFSFTYVGSGLAMFDLALNQGFGVPSWIITRTRGELSSAPIPEPATLLLVASGGALAAYRRRRCATRQAR